jgi:TPR repeat protein
MDFQEIKDRVNSGAYETKISYNTSARLAEDAVIDENQTVVWNRRMVKEHNDKIIMYHKEYQADQNRLANQFSIDLISAIAEDLSITPEKAQHIYSKAYADGHSDGYYNVVIHAEELCDMVSQIL